MDIITPERFSEFSALGTILLVVIIAVWKGIPALIAYMERKDATHREDIQNLIVSSREERETFYKNLHIQLDKIHTRLDRIETSVMVKPETPSSTKK